MTSFVFVVLYVATVVSNKFILRNYTYDLNMSESVKRNTRDTNNQKDSLQFSETDFLGQMALKSVSEENVTSLRKVSVLLDSGCEIINHSATSPEERQHVGMVAVEWGN